jgi:sec-independent protein translocase protein TatB
MSGVSSAELILLIVIGLVVLGPKRLPEIANKIGSWIGQARRMTRIMKRQLEEELNLDDFNSIQPPKISQQTDSADEELEKDKPA